MRVVLYMAVSVDGFIARNDDDTSWISRAEWDSYSSRVRQAGCLIIGHRTYDILTKQPEFTEFKDIKIIVVSQRSVPLLSPGHLLAHSPSEALTFLKDFHEAVVAGGSLLNASFLDENLLDEIYLDIEPVILGAGVPLFKDKDSAHDLKLVGIKNISEDEVQLHYEIIK